VDQQDDELSHLLPLFVEGQVHKMIAEATNVENLVQLYVGWMPLGLSSEYGVLDLHENNRRYKLNTAPKQTHTRFDTLL
jgi:hypothetical protein